MLIFVFILFTNGGVCIMAGLLIVHSKFDFKEKFYQARALSTKTSQDNEDYYYNTGSRKRRDDQYRETGKPYEYHESRSSSGYGEKYQSSMSTVILPLIESMELEESIGSPLVFAGLSIGSLLIASLLSFGEHCLVRKSGEVNYESMYLS